MAPLVIVLAILFTIFYFWPTVIILSTLIIGFILFVALVRFLVFIFVDCDINL